MAYSNQEEFFAQYPKNEVFGYIYIWTNKINGKQYVGQAMSHRIELREREHITLGIQKIDKAIKKYGEENFDRILIDVAYSSDELNEKESSYIELYGTFKRGYNYTIGGDGVGCGEFSSRFIGDYYQINNIFGEFVDCYAGASNTSANLYTLFENDGANFNKYKTACLKVHKENKSTIYHNVIISPITKEQYHDYKVASVIPIDVTEIFSTELTYNAGKMSEINFAGSSDKLDFDSIVINDFLSTLTPRERKVVTLRLSGETHRSIGAIIGISHHAVQKSLKKIGDKYSKYFTVEG